MDLTYVVIGTIFFKDICHIQGGSGSFCIFITSYGSALIASNVLDVSTFNSF